MRCRSPCGSSPAPATRSLCHRRAWPNFEGAIALAGARSVHVPMTSGERWSLDIDRLAAAITPATRGDHREFAGQSDRLYRNARGTCRAARVSRAVAACGSSPTKYTDVSSIRANASPSFHDVMDRDDRILFLQTLSKNWAMTGLADRLARGATGARADHREYAVQYTTSGVPVFIQRAAIAAIEQGEPFLAGQIARMRRSRDIICEGLAATGRVRFAWPEAAFYCSARCEGERRHADARHAPRRRGRARRRARLGVRSRRRGLTSGCALLDRPSRSPRRRGASRRGSRADRAAIRRPARAGQGQVQRRPGFAQRDRPVRRSAHRRDRASA